MIILDDVTSKLQLTTSAAETVNVVVSYKDRVDATAREQYRSQETAITTATTTDILAVPADGRRRQVLHITVTSLTGTTVCTLKKDVNGTDYQIGGAVSLAIGEWLTVDSEGEFQVFSSSGAVKTNTGASGGDALTTDPLSQFAATTSAQLAATITNETGTGALVFANTPTLVTPVLGTPGSGTLTNCTGLPVTTGLTAGTWKVFSSDAGGAVDELALGAIGTVFQSGGPAAAPSFGKAWTVVQKTADEARTADITLTNDAALTLACSATTTYIIRCIVILKTANATMDFKYALNYSGTTTGDITSHGHQLPAGATPAVDIDTTGIIAAAVGSTSVTATTSGTARLEWEQTFTTDSSGTWSFQWAQNTSDAGALTVLKGSYLEWMIVA